MRTRARVIVLGLVAVACAQEPVATREALVNGSPSPDTAVVAVIHTRPTGTQQLCTGTLIARAVVLTAKHCVFEDMGGADWVANPVSSMSVRFGASVTAPDGEIAVTAIATTPGAYRDGAGAMGGDIALLTLASAATVAPADVSIEAPTSGLALRIAGYGYTEAGSMGTLGERREGSASIVSVAAGTFTSEGASWTCTGDSGGPAFRASDGAVVGVTSIGPRGCPASTSIYTRLDAHVDLLTAAGVVVGAPDAGPVATTDAPPIATADAGTTPPSASAGCGCRASARPRGAIAVMGLAVVLWWAREAQKSRRMRTSAARSCSRATGS